MLDFLSKLFGSFVTNSDYIRFEDWVNAKLNPGPADSVLAQLEQIANQLPPSQKALLKKYIDSGEWKDAFADNIE